MELKRDQNHEWKEKIKLAYLRVDKLLCEQYEREEISEVGYKILKINLDAIMKKVSSND